MKRIKLTERQTEVLVGLSYGLTYQEIAQELGIGFQTVKEHAKVVRAKMGAKSKTEAVLVGFRTGILQREFSDE